MPKVSLIWDYFAKIIENRASCIECGEDYKVLSGRTTGMRDHLRAKHKTSFEKLEAREARAKARSIAATFDANSDSDNDLKVGTFSGAGSSRTATVWTPARKRSRKEQIPGDKTSTNRVFTKSQWSRNDDEQKEVVAAMMQWVASAMLPFDVVDNDDFKHFVKVCKKGQYKPFLQGQFLVPKFRIYTMQSRQQLIKHIMKTNPI